MRPTITLLLSALLTLACDDSEPQTLRFADTDMICVNKLGAAYVEDKNTCDPGYSWYCDVHGPTVGTSACCDEQGDCTIIGADESACPVGTSTACGPAVSLSPHVCGGEDGVSLYIDGSAGCDVGYVHWCSVGEFEVNGIITVCCGSLLPGATCATTVFGDACANGLAHVCDRV